MVHPFRMIISGKGEEEDIEEQGVQHKFGLEGRLVNLYQGIPTRS